MTKLRYCGTTRLSDIVTEQERSLATSTRHRPQGIRKAKSLHTAVFQARDISQHLVETSLSPQLW